MSQIQTDALLVRLVKLEAADRIRRLMSDYLHLCDDLSSLESAQRVGALFTEDACWEGVGERYAGRLGRHCGRAAITAMMAKYAGTPAHFAVNAHFLCSEALTVVDESRAHGRWQMLQTSSFSAGGSHLNAAELQIEFRRHRQQWLIHHFTTRNLFSRPVSGWHSSAALPVPTDPGADSCLSSGDKQWK